MFPEPYREWVSQVFLFALVFVGIFFASQGTQAQTYRILHTFTGSPDGNTPNGVIRDAAGNLYGTTFGGGVPDYGTAFKLAPNGKETVLYNFLAGYGAFPSAGLIRGPKGIFYGITYQGGDYAAGTVFTLDKHGNEAVLHSFTPAEKGGPLAGLVRDAEGNLYGVGEGENYDSLGIVFKVNRRGKATVLHTFTGGKDGGYPEGLLALDKAGNLYGTTIWGGDHGQGVVFKFDKARKFKVVYSFTGTAGNGGSPSGPLIFDAAGNIYGTTGYGGDLSCGPFGCGIVFKLDRAGKESVLHIFTGSDKAHPDGAFPYGLLRDVAGNLYGTTASGGSSSNCSYGNVGGCGTVFKLNTTGKVTLLHSFTLGDGATPSDLIRDRAGNFYGTTEAGGDLNCSGGFAGSGCGVVFKLSPH
jgi:uncharacterized repeat protein (TIGR03803 family)